MGRSRGVFHADEDPTQRSRRKKNASTGGHLESSLASQVTADGKRALYHCNYCNKDITGRIRIKCAVCPDFDLCVECFSVGAGATPHISNHPYRVMDSLSFPLFCPDWNADEEILLLEGLEMYGLGNWAEVAEHVGTKNKEQCINHYKNVYLNSPCFPLPDMTHVVGKNRNELLAMAKGNSEEKKGMPSFNDLSLKQESPFSPSRVKVEKLQKGSRLVSSQNTDGRPSLVGLSGYNPKRQEFEPEYDNDAEQLLADMEFKDTDTEDERELKLHVLRIYSKRLDERKRRKDFVLERNLLYPNPFEKDFTQEEKELCRRYDPFMRLHSKEEHEELLRTVIDEHRTLKRIQELQEARAAGCRTSAEADRYLELKRKKEAEERTQKSKESAHVMQNSQDAPNTSAADSNTRTPGQATPGSANGVEMPSYPGEVLLSETEKQLCREIKMPPPIYMKLQQLLAIKIFSGEIASISDARRLFRMEPSKIDGIYEMLVKKGIAPP
ncbi:Transcriptional adapter ADA2b-like protein [Drosera capensis]